MDDVTHDAGSICHAPCHVARATRGRVVRDSQSPRLDDRSRHGVQSAGPGARG